MEIVKRMDAAELSAWRQGKTIDSSAGPTPAGGSVVRRGYVKPLGAADTRTEVFEHLWESMTRDRDTFEAAIRWMRRRRPGLGHKTDDELKDFLYDFTREAVQSSLGPKGLLGMNSLDGIWT